MCSKKRGNLLVVTDTLHHVSRKMSDESEGDADWGVVRALPEGNWAKKYNIHDNKCIMYLL